MPTTSNFGWTTPADTDLVKDGAAAIRTLGNGIDTSFIDLKGGTTGQVLSKASNTDLDYSWVTPNVGDITEVQAGTGISVASGTGPIPVVTNTVATAYDAKGDLIVGTGADTFSRLAVGGTNGHTLQVDSSTSTGLKWAAPATSTFPAFRATNNATQSLSADTWTKVTLQTETFDTDNCFASSTFTPTTAGYYQINGSIKISGATAYYYLAIYKNGSADTLLGGSEGQVSEVYLSGAGLVYLNGTTDYVELYAYSSQSTTIANGSGSEVRFSGVGIRS